MALAGAVITAAPSQRYLQATGWKKSLLSFERIPMTAFALKFWTDDKGQDIAEYAMMLAVILVLVVGTIRLVGSNANNVFSSAASSIK
jgi:Flp pilus assembly pilin Flp